MDGAREMALALADDELCIGQNLAWWIAVGPFLEEDLALTSISQDELGHARALYGLRGDDIDALAYGRQPHEYRRCAPSSGRGTVAPAPRVGLAVTAAAHRGRSIAAAPALRSIHAVGV